MAVKLLGYKCMLLQQAFLCVCGGGSRELNIGSHAYKYFIDWAISLAPEKLKHMHAYMYAHTYAQTLFFYIR